MYFLNFDSWGVAYGELFRWCRIYLRGKWTPICRLSYKNPHVFYVEKATLSALATVLFIFILLYIIFDKSFRDFDIFVPFIVYFAYYHALRLIDGTPIEVDKDDT